MSRRLWKKAISITLSAVLVVTPLQMGNMGNTTAQAAQMENEARESVILTDAQIDTLYNQYFGDDNVYDRVSVHDPSIVVGYTDITYDGKNTTKVYGVQNESNTRKEVYFVFGSHMAFAYSVDLKNWKTFTNNINTNYATLMKEGFDWAARGDSVYEPSGNMWAPDVFWNATMGKWCMYMSINGCSWNSVIILLTADSLNGEWTYVGPVVYSGFTDKGTTRSYTDTNFGSVFDSEADAKAAWEAHYKGNAYTEKDNGTVLEATTWNKHYGAHAIDPCITYDSEGNLWMSYGSWSGGIWMFKIDPATGLRDKNEKYEYKANVSDPYMGYKLAGGTGASGEASYIEKIGDKYWLFLSYGGLVANGGYNMRAFSSDKITGPYKDLQGNDARYGKSDSGYEAGTYSDKAGTANGRVGSRLMTYYDWNFLKMGRVAQGHNSAFVDDDGKAYLIYHTRFNNGTEWHEMRVHQLFTAKNGGLVTAPFEYSGETLSKTAYAADEVAGEYTVLYHDPTVNHQTLTCVQEQVITLKEDGTITGDYTGTWTQEADGPYVTLEINKVSYKGVFIKQNIEETGDEVMCFTTVGNNDVAFWGTRSFSDKAVVVKNAKKFNPSIPKSTYIDLNLPTNGEYGAVINWSSSNSDVMTDDGQVKEISSDTEVTLTNTITKGNYNYKKQYKIMVKVPQIPADTTTGLAASYNFDEGIVNSVNDSQKGIAKALAAGTKPTLEYSKERGSNILHQYFGFESEKTTSYVEYNNPLKGKNLTGATVSLWVNRQDTDVWDAIWSFYDTDNSDGYDGRLYLTPNSYLGYNGTGGFFDCNHPDNGTLETITPKEWKLVTVTVDKDNFGIYVDGQLVYDKTTNNAYGSTEGKTYTAFGANLLKVLASADYFYTGYGSWWGSAPLLLDNLKIYDRALSVIDVAGLYKEEQAEIEKVKETEKAKEEEIASKSYYYNSFNYATGVTGWQSGQLDGLILESDGTKEHGNFVKFQFSASGSRCAYHAFDFADKTLPNDNYMVEFDVQLNNGKDRDSQLALMSNSYNYKTVTDKIASGYIWEMTGTQNTDIWTLNGTSITIPKSTWIHISTEIDNLNKKAKVVITNEATGQKLHNEEAITIDLTETAQAAGLFVLNARTYAMTAFDNIRVRDMVVAPDKPILESVVYTPTLKLSDIALPEGWTWDKPDTLLSNIGTNSYPASYKTTNSSEYKDTKEDLEVTVKQATPEYKVVTGLKGYKGKKLSTVNIPADENGKWEWVNPDTVMEESASEYAAKYIPTDEHYSIAFCKLVIEIQEAPAEPVEPDTPEPKTIQYTPTLTLQDIVLPNGWTWKNPATPLTSIGTASYPAIYTTTDPEIYKDAAADIQVTVEKATPTYTAVSGLTGTLGEKLSTVVLPTDTNGTWQWLTPDTVMTTSTNIFDAVFTPKDSEHYAAVNCKIEVTIKDESGNDVIITPTAPELEAITYEFGLVLGNVTLPTAWKWKDSNIELSAGTKEYDAIYVPNQDNVKIEVTVLKNSKPNYAVVQNLKGVEGDKLSTITLPAEWKWKNPDEELSLKESKYTAVFTHSSGNYEDIEVLVDVAVTAKKVDNTGGTNTDKDKDKDKNPNNPGTVSKPGTTNKPSTAKPQKGKVYTVGGIQYKVTNTTSKTASIVGLSKSAKKKKTITIKKTVKILKVSFKITEIGSSAFTSCKKLQKVTIGENVTKIGKKAFYKCSKLKTITVKSKKLKSAGKNAFKGIYKKAVIKVPKSKLKNYKKLLKKKGQSSKVKIKK